MRPLLVLLVAVFGAVATSPVQAGASERPNILWITVEDISPHLGCYGDPDAITPNLDALARGGVLYEKAFATSGVCAPARSCLATGRYPSTLGSQFMRCTVKLPEGMKFFTNHLREAGYYCTNHTKEDYNLVKPKGAWDVSGGKAHWRGRAEGQPFFSVFNLTLTHESKIRCSEKQFAQLTEPLSDAQRHDPAAVAIPPYHPDTPAVRRDKARLHDLITAMDHRVAERLRELEQDGLREDTIVVFFSDHGDGLPRGKRWIYDSGIHVPLILSFPEKYRHLAPAAPGARLDRLVSFVDFGPTMLSLCGVEVPGDMHGRPFLGSAEVAPREYVYAIRDRMDERYDIVRAVRGQRYKYIRNYRPDLGYCQHLEYMDEMPTMKELRRLAAAGELSGHAGFFMREEKASEELYDLQSDPHEVVNLAADPTHAEALARLRGAHGEWVRRTRDLGTIPEPRLRALSAGTTAYEFGASQSALVTRIQTAAALATGTDPSVASLLGFLEDDEPAVRCWGVLGLRRVSGADPELLREALRAQLRNPSPSLQILAAESMLLGAVRGSEAGAGSSRDRDAAMEVLAAALKSKDEWVRVMAANAIDHAGEAATGVREMMEAALKDKNKYVVRILKQAMRELDAE